MIGRIYAKRIAELLKENWIVENVSGGNGTIGTHSVAKSAPDGRTLLFTADVHSMAREASESPDLRQRLVGLGVTPIWETPEAFAGHALAEFQDNSRILQQAGVKPE